jgi:ABC-type transport system involved in cytochrome c biogenesis permease subunit
MDKKNIIVGIVALTIGVILGVFLANAEWAQAPSAVESEMGR